jgi:hypothetical protein
VCIVACRDSGSKDLLVAGLRSYLRVLMDREDYLGLDPLVSRRRLLLSIGVPGAAGPHRQDP